MKNLKNAPKISFPLIILFFLLPFVTVKCGDYKIARLNGIDLVTGTQIAPQSSDQDPVKVDPNIFVIAALSLAVIGGILAFLKFKSRNIILLIVCVLGVASLIAFYFNAKSSEAGQGTFVIIISMGIGYYLSLLGFLFNSFVFGYELANKENSEIQKTTDNAAGNETNI